MCSLVTGVQTCALPICTTVATAMVFGSVSGSAAATVSAIGRIMYPELRKNGYSERFSIGLIAAGSETALLIPPSITVIIYGWLTGASITKLFAAGLIIGLVLGGLFIGYVVIQSIRHDVGRLERRSEEHTSELQSLMRISYAVFCLKKKK